MIPKDLFYRFWFLSLLILQPVLGQNNSLETVLFSNNNGTGSYFYSEGVTEAAWTQPVVSKTINSNY